MLIMIKQLQKLLNVLSDDVSLSLTKFGDKAVSLNVKNGAASVDYVLSDLSVIAEAPALKKIPEFGTEIKLDTKFIQTFIKGKSALSDVDTFTLVVIVASFSIIFKVMTLSFMATLTPSNTVISLGVIDSDVLVSFNEGGITRGEFYDWMSSRRLTKKDQLKKKE